VETVYLNVSKKEHTGGGKKKRLQSSLYFERERIHLRGIRKETERRRKEER